MKQAMVIDTMDNEVPAGKGTLLCARKQVKKKKKTSFRSAFGKGACKTRNAESLAFARQL